MTIEGGIKSGIGCQVAAVVHDDNAKIGRVGSEIDGAGPAIVCTAATVRGNISGKGIRIETNGNASTPTATPTGQNARTTVGRDCAAAIVITQSQPHASAGAAAG